MSIRLRDIYGGDTERNKMRLQNFLTIHNVEPVDLRVPELGEWFVPTGFDDSSVPLIQGQSFNVSRTRLIVQYIGNYGRRS